MILPYGCPDQQPEQAPRVLPLGAKCRNFLPCNYLINKWESDDKPGSVMRLPAPDRHSSRGTVTRTLKQPTRKAMVGPTTFPIWSCSKRGMPSMPRHRGIWWALTPPFHPYPAQGGAVCFLWRCPRVAPPGCYPAFCPVEPGLSSPGLAARSDGLSDSHLLIWFSGAVSGTCRTGERIVFSR